MVVEASKAGAPLLRYLTVVLTNGASIRVPVAINKEAPAFTTFVSTARWRRPVAAMIYMALRSP